MSSFNASHYEAEWIQSLKDKLGELEEEFNTQRTQKLRARDEIRLALSDSKVAVSLHGRALIEFFSQSSSGQKCFSNATCFGCLMAVPEIPLACGHAFCKSCIAEHGEASSDLSIYLRFCPLHPQGGFDWEVPQKPEFAGIRILALDGGGIRGIVELELLKAIESRINVRSTSGSSIPIQWFFDLIVGTSAGGIIALGLTVKRWSVGHCITEFVRLCDKAFSPRELNGGKLEKLVTLNHGSKWRTTPLYEALQQAFGHRPIFGGQISDSRKYATKVAVVSTSQSDCRPLLITNYNREEASDPGHSLELSDSPSTILKTWEAAAATSAAPSLFKPFECHGKTYLDGALNHNNPVYIAWREKKQIWPDVLSKHPDILVSLGTGQHKTEVDKLKRSGPIKPKRSASDRLPSTSDVPRASSKRYKAWNGVRNYFSVRVRFMRRQIDRLSVIRLLTQITGQQD